MAWMCVDDCGDPGELLVAFLNTLDVEDGRDVLSTEDGWRAWATEHGLGAICDGDDLDAVRALRDDLRAVAMGAAEPVLEVPVTVRVAGDRVALGGDGPRAVMAASAAQLAVEHRLDRVKICPADDCLWAFYDSSRNQSRTWCSMNLCGTLAQARNHRERAAGG